MKELIDYDFSLTDGNNATKVTDANAIVMAIRNIIFSRPGTFPLTPEIGVNIWKYQFDILDETTIETIKSDISAQIEKAIPSLNNVQIVIQKVEDIINGQQITALGISVKGYSGNETAECNYLLRQDTEEVYVLNGIK